MSRVLDRFMEQQKWLDKLGDPLQKYISSLFANGGATGKQVKDLLNGTWLGHPLHPLLTDVPVGAWTATMVLDTIASVREDESLGNAADITLAVGLTAAAASAVTGFTDWTDTYGQERKVGLLHGLAMLSSFTAYTVSLLARLSGSRSAGLKWSTAGFALTTAGAYLGGDEVYHLGYGVNHTAFEHAPSDFVPVMAQDELQADKPTKADAKGVPVLLVRQGSRVYALSDTCVHAGCSLSSGRLEGRSVICPCHGSRFDLSDGSVINGPATMPEPRFEVRVQGGMIEVKGA